MFNGVNGRHQVSVLFDVSYGTDGVDGLNHAGHLVAGAAAGAAEHVLMFPIDSVKTRMQV